MFYTDEKNAQMVIKFLKEFNVRKIIMSPGNTNVPIAESVQYDDFFEGYSCTDERSAAYLACGLAEESGEPVAISCTGATASRNYMPALTEAYYRKLPIIAITSVNGNENIGNLIAQNIDRSVVPNDVAKCSVSLPKISSNEDFWYCKHLLNKAFLELFNKGGGPIHINLPTTYQGTFTTRKLPDLKIAKKVTLVGTIPNIENYKKIGILIGSHKQFKKTDIELIERFCEYHNACVFKDLTSAYNGKYAIQTALLATNGSLSRQINQEIKPELVIHLGEISGDYPTLSFIQDSGSPIWRVSEDGELRDTFRNLEYVFEMSENFFFSRYTAQSDSRKDTSYFESLAEFDSKLREKIPKLPFSNIWINKRLSESITENYVLHFGILNSLRSANFFNFPANVKTYCNVGGFGIDGAISTFIGGAFAEPNKEHLLILGDLAFFYDMNIIGNRDLPNNIKIILINNGGGAEFKNYSHLAARLGEKADEFVAATNHFQTRGDVSPAQAWVNSFGMEYFSAKNQADFEEQLTDFISFTNKKPSLLECTTNFVDESDALKEIDNLNKEFTTKEKVKRVVKSHVPADVIDFFKNRE